MATTRTSNATAGPAPTAGVEPAPRGRPSLHRIWCTIDFSEASVAALAEAAALAQRCHGEITVLFVIPHAAGPRALSPAVPEGVNSAVAEEIETLLAPVRAAGIPVRVCLKAGWPAREILETVRRVAPDVIVMGTHGRGGFNRWALGSVTDEVLRSAVCPVLTIGPGGRGPAAPARSNAIVCAVGLSASSARTVALASQVARATGARLTLLHVLNAGAEHGRDAGLQLHALAVAHGEAADRTEEVVVTGAAAREILRMARARHAALIVVGGERLSDGVRVASTAEKVIRRARCGVLSVRGQSKTS